MHKGRAEYYRAPYIIYFISLATYTPVQSGKHRHTYLQTLRRIWQLWHALHCCTSLVCRLSTLASWLFDVYSTHFSTKNMDTMLWATSWFVIGGFRLNGTTVQVVIPETSAREFSAFSQYSIQERRYRIAFHFAIIGGAKRSCAKSSVTAEEVHYNNQDS